MDCSRVREELLDRFDESELEQLPETLQLHLCTCSSCRAELGKLRELSAGLGELPVPDCGENFRTNLLPSLRFRLDQLNSEKPRKDLIWAPSMALAILFALILLGQPTQITPPSWVQAGISSGMAETSTLINSDYESLSEALESRDSLALGLTGAEMDLILSLSDTTKPVPEDPLDQLVNMDDRAVEAILKSLETSSIRS
jgi:hypothetical protein